MGCSTSKPSKSTRKLSKPSKPTPLIPLSYPYLEPLPFRPLPHHPVASGLTPEQEFASRYGRMLVENPIFAGTQKYETACRPQMRKETAPVPQQSKRVKAAKPKALYQLKPLNEIGATTPANQSGYSLYPSGQKGDFRDDVCE